MLRNRVQHYPGHLWEDRTAKKENKPHEHNEKGGSFWAEERHWKCAKDGEYGRNTLQNLGLFRIITSIISGQNTPHNDS